MKVQGTHYRTVRLDGSTVHLINQPILPHRFEVIALEHHRETADAIQTMIVRGAGAIGATGASGMAQAAFEAPDEGFHNYMAQAAETMRNTRPTAQNLFYGVNRVLAATRDQSPANAREAAYAAAQAVADEDASCCKAIGEHGSTLIKDDMRITTHCNAGWLAFVDWGSALSPIYVAHRQGKKVFVWADETRPRSQGARLTAWELGQEGVPHAVIADNAQGTFMSHGEVDMVIVGSDRIAANGDVANKIGTYNVATLAAANGVPFYVAAPSTTIDWDCPGGDQIPIEERSGDEVAYTWGWSDDGEFIRVRTVAPRSSCRNPAFDVTPASMIQGIITEAGIFAPDKLADLRT
ncbi:MAG: S-methyl-5-thioribose-1-phosphate isomerase [Proteobacteria bacterium]|jgi:methylthioribose-1-phosphate isomerase|nr:S-methyl-5-thioribose-1-phosphate isomerase [Pseudomonadota bacterium]